MKRIKRFYREHRIFTILMAIVLVCVILIGTVLIQCFYIGKDNDKYGNRLENIALYELTDEHLNQVHELIVAEPTVKSAEVFVTGRIVYININYEGKTELVEAENVAVKILDQFTTEEQTYYDFNFTLKKEKTETSDKFIISGAKNKNRATLVWNNNSPVEEDPATAEE